MLGYYIAAIAGAVFGAGMICILIGGGKDIERVTRCKDCADRARSGSSAWKMRTISAVWGPGRSDLLNAKCKIQNAE